MSRTVENSADAPYDEIRIFNRVNHKQILHTRDRLSSSSPRPQGLAKIAYKVWKHLDKRFGH